MFIKNHNYNKQEIELYNKILLLSRNKLLYTNLNLQDTFQNRINLIFFHISFLFIRIKNSNKYNEYKDFQQRMFDYIFDKIEINMRENGMGDVTVNKNMKFLVKAFYDILLNCENYEKKNLDNKNIFILKHLDLTDKKKLNTTGLVDYFDKYRTFCLDLTLDKVLMGELNFSYK